MTDKDTNIVLGATAGGGGAGSAIVENIPNPIEGVFDGVDPSPGSKKPDEILVARNVVRRFGGQPLAAHNSWQPAEAFGEQAGRTCLQERS